MKGKLQCISANYSSVIHDYLGILNGRDGYIMLYVLKVILWYSENLHLIDDNSMAK